MVNNVSERVPCLLWSRRTVLFQPGKDFIVPEAAVGWFEDPVPLIGEVDVFAGDTETLQGSKQLIALGDRNAKIEVIVNDQHWRFEVCCEAMR